MRRATVALLVAVAACAKLTVHTSDGDVGPPGRSGAEGRRVGERVIRVALATGATNARMGASGGWRLYAGDGASMVVRGTRAERWRIEVGGSRIRAVRSDGVATPWTQPPLLARPDDGALLSFNDKRYRGELAFHVGDSGVVVVNRVRLDDYLKGVVPLEIGRRDPSDSAAIQAQAVTARSYAYITIGANPSRSYDLTAGVLDQVYGGADVETPAASAAIESTSGLLLQYGGRVVNAPYHSTCGGSTAEASEVWRNPGEPYLRSVSDRVSGTDRYYCDIAPRFRWTRTVDAATLNAAVARYLAAYVKVPGGDPGRVQSVAVDRRTPSGRVGILAIATDRGNFTLRGNDTRFVLRTPGGEILNSTYFSAETERARDGSVARLTIRGTGYGHGVGMCQWGAIGRARAGQDFRTILAAYYPGTTVAPLP